MSSVQAPPVIGGIDHWREAFRTLAPSLPFAGTQWLDGVRRQAIDGFASKGWPSNRQENWRHTSLLFMDAEKFTPTARTPALANGDQAKLRSIVEAFWADDDGHWLVFVDGHVMPALSRPISLPDGVSVAAWSQCEPDDSLQSLFDDQSIDIVESPAVLNAAFATDGAVIRIAQGVTVAEPLHLVFIAASPGAATHVRNLVIAATGAKATVVEHYFAFGGAATGDATLTNVVTRIHAAADASISHVKLQQESPTAVHLAAIDAVQERGSHFGSHSLSFGARLARHDITTRLDGENCSVLLNGLYHVDGRRHVDHHTRINHAQPRGSSREFYRGILDDSARGVFTGRIVVAPGAVRTDAVQRTDSLLLSGRAETDARPELEIYADDVQCAHGATVGQIDEAALFYLRTRGLDEEHARNMLTYAFAAQAVDRIELPSLRRRAASAIRSRLPGASAIESLEARS